MRIEALSTVVAALESGKRPKGGASGETGTVPSLGGEHLSNDGGFRLENLKYIDEQFFVDLKKGAIKTNDILIVKDGATTGKVSYVGSDFPFERAAINEHLFALTIDSKIANPRYVFSFLKSPQGQKEILKDFRGAAIGGISRGFVDLAKIPLPSLDDQIRIAHLLGKVEGLIAQRKQHLQQIDDLLKSVFLEMFGNPVRNEHGWPTEPLGTLATIERGRFSPRPRNDPRYYGGNYPFIQTGDISRSKGRLREYTQTLNELGTKVSKEFGIDTIVIAIVGATIGETAILEIPTYAPDSVIGITPLSADSRDSVFIEYVLRFWKPVLRARAPDAARANINIETLRPLQIIVPPERHKFSELMRKLEGLDISVQKSLTDLETLYGALSQKAFKGELDLTRVLLPAFPAEGEQHVTVAPMPPQAVEPAIHLSVTDIPPTALEIPEMRGHLLTQWLESYRVQLGNATFSVQQFMAAAQTRLAELHPDIDVELGAADYEHTKQWVFEALHTGKLVQAMDDAGNRIQLKAAQA